MQTRWLFRITYLYLTLPFIIFCMGWLRLSIAIPVVAVLIWVLWQLLMQSPNSQPSEASRFPIYLLLLTGLWVLLSGVGGYAFQNWDHHWRNAQLRDLITYEWPVIYSAPERGPIKMLVYYVGYWLPSALVGKAFGFGAANFFLFLWTWLGVFLVSLHLSLKLKTSSIKALLLLIFFSGMDALGTLLVAGDYPTLWSPVQHLEIWAGNLQYSSFTTQLFWVFNQAVPAWLCISLILNNDVVARAVLSRPKQSPLELGIVPPRRHGDASGEDQLRPRNDMKVFLWSLCFFFAPLASIGLLPYLIIEWIKQTKINRSLRGGYLPLPTACPEPVEGKQSPVMRRRLTFRNVGGRYDLLFASLLIVVISYLFFSSNAAAQERGFQALAIKDILIFFLLEGGMLWLLLAPRLWRDPCWMVTGLLLIFIPFIQLGSGRDFVMRASIAPLFYLMIMCAEAILQNPSPRLYRMALIAILLIGAWTPLYEINRSVYRTFEYYFILDKAQRPPTPPKPATHLEPAGAPEHEHPGALTADEIVTLQFMDDKLSQNFIANTRPSLYYRYLSPR